MTKSKHGSSPPLCSIEHGELVKELGQIERMTNQERLKLAANRRKQQLKAWNVQEKLWIQKEKLGSNLPPGDDGGGNKGKGKKGGRRIKFRNSIMLLEAAGRNDVEEVRRLLESGVDADVANEDGLTALHQCCIDDNEELLLLLLEFGADVNSEDSEKWTPLHAAATCGHLHLVKHLIGKGASLLSVNAEGNMPYDICDEEGTLDYIEGEMAKGGVTQELIEEIRALPETTMLQDMERIVATGGDLHERDEDGATYLHIACANGWIRVVEFLLDHQLSTDVQDKDCWQPIHAAACWGHIDVLELLVQNGGDLNARTKNNETPYGICEDVEMKERIIQLRSEMETRVGGVRRVKRSQSSNSRTQSIRRTSHRDKALATKRDVADEAQILMNLAHHDMSKENSPSPSPSTELPSPHQGEKEEEKKGSSGEEEEEEGEGGKSLPPSLAYGRDSITQLMEGRTPRGIVERSEVKYNNPIAIPVRNSMPNRTEPPQLPPPDINPRIVDLSTISTTQGGGGGGKDGVIDIHVQVTINTNNKTNNNNTGNNSTFTPPGTLADLKKQRSLHYRSNSISSLTGFPEREPPPKYSPPSSPTLSLKRFSGPPGEIVGDYSSRGKKCCTIV